VYRTQAELGAIGLSVVYFLCHPDPANYQWDIVPLAEGLAQLGVASFSSADYWVKPDGSYLLQLSKDVDPLSCDVVVVSSGFLKWVKDSGAEERGELPDWLSGRQGHKAKIVALDVCDGYLSPTTQRWADCFDLILRSHYNRRLWWPANVRPWAFGLTERILTASATTRLPWEQREGCVWAFGASHGYRHGAREWAGREIRPSLSRGMTINDREDDLNTPPSDPRDALLWKQCVRRHSPSHFARLGSSKACAAFCGELVPGLPPHVSFLVGGNKAKLRRLAWQCISSGLRLPPRNVQPDSWRFWEAMGSETAVLHFDMEQSGWQLPVMPENWKHYIGIDLRRPHKSVERISCEPELLERVARDGRQWALENYSPQRAAQRLLEWCA